MSSNIFVENQKKSEENFIRANNTTIFLTDGEEKTPSYPCNIDVCSSGKKSQWGKKKVGLDTRSFYRYQNGDPTKDDTTKKYVDDADNALVKVK